MLMALRQARCVGTIDDVGCRKLASLMMWSSDVLAPLMTWPVLWLSDDVSGFVFTLSLSLSSYEEDTEEGKYRTWPPPSI